MFVWGSEYQWFSTLTAQRLWTLDLGHWTWDFFRTLDISAYQDIFHGPEASWSSSASGPFNVRNASGSDVVVLIADCQLTIFVMIRLLPANRQAESTIGNRKNPVATAPGFVIEW